MMKICLLVTLMLLCGLMAMPMTVLAESYSYDTYGRLASVTYDDNSAITYSYDAMGNQLKATASDAPSTPTPGGGGGSLSPAGPALLLFALLSHAYARRNRHGRIK